MTAVEPNLVPEFADPDSAAFWEACQRRELRLQRCSRCGTYIHFPAPRCYACLSTEITWEAVSGNGTVYTFTVVHHAISPEFKERVPYVVAWIELEVQPGLRILSNVVGCEPEDVKIGMPVRVTFAERSPGFLVPVFVPRADGEQP